MTKHSVIARRVSVSEHNEAIHTLFVILSVAKYPKHTNLNYGRINVPKANQPQIRLK